jgi:UDP-N-acetylmuramate: L-alanyl-gamma-D-glutamyl-meso-diaminopimelate ligase
VHLHILGICGTFMGGIAAIAKQAGHRVSGCDANVYPPMSTQLEALGIALTQGWDAGQLQTVAKGADVFVVGNALSRGNPLVEAILDGGFAYTSGPQWLYENVLRDKWVLAVAGTHGKTTTTSILAWILEHAGLAPGFLIGGIPANFNLSARLSASDSPFFVIEADEYDTAFFDKRSKFVHYRPRAAVLNNLEYDHADIFPDLAAIETQFHHLVRSVPARGRLVVNRETSLDRVLAQGCWSEVERFGDGPDGWRIDDAGNVFLRGQAQGRLEWSLWGRHNRLNALAAIAAARHAGVPVREALSALREFRGIKRRLETRGVAGGVTVYDDFAHHPTAIRETIAALRQHIGAARLIAVLEPRSNTMKLGTMKQQLPGSLEDAEAIFCYAHNLGWDPREALAPLGERARVHGDLDELVSAVAKSARPLDHVLVMSNGGFGGVHEKLLQALSGSAA